MNRSKPHLLREGQTWLCHRVPQTIYGSVIPRNPQVPPSTPSCPPAQKYHRTRGTFHDTSGISEGSSAKRSAGSSTWGMIGGSLTQILGMAASNCLNRHISAFFPITNRSGPAEAQDLMALSPFVLLSLLRMRFLHFPRFTFSSWTWNYHSVWKTNELNNCLNENHGRFHDPLGCWSGVTISVATWVSGRKAMNLATGAAGSALTWLEIQEIPGVTSFTGE